MDKKIKVRIYKYLDDRYSLVLERTGQDVCERLTNLQLEDIRQLARDLTTAWAKISAEVNKCGESEMRNHLDGEKIGDIRRALGTVGIAYLTEDVVAIVEGRASVMEIPRLMQIAWEKGHADGYNRGYGERRNILNHL